MRDEKEERKKQARSNKQKQSNTAHPRQSLLLEKMSCLGSNSNPRLVYRQQLSYRGLGQNLTSHSTPGEQANHQLSMKEKAGVMNPPHVYQQQTTCIVQCHVYRQQTIHAVHQTTCTCWVCCVALPCLFV